MSLEEVIKHTKAKLHEPKANSNKSDLLKLILKEEFNAGDWFNKLNRLSIKKLKSISQKLGVIDGVKSNPKKIDLVTKFGKIIERRAKDSMPKTNKISPEKKTESNIKGYSTMNKSELIQRICDKNQMPGKASPESRTIDSAQS
ncbi:hypothetical protein BDFB_013868 [Asbolus verrucosus]|uniref:Rho termination factor N-terminal domain-containing protein n=1 Tax=Asbolus verrucosus TaxID=1661398 RepID=A0A482VY37_ASBVE|nr:hypothetical protein BDFB_013868 [Asbolus verrucosus]